jgi:hypothetical protein
MTRIGIVARSENRGLGHLTWEAWRHLDGASALVVSIGQQLNHGFDEHFDRYYGERTYFTKWDNGRLEEPVVREWLRHLDVVYVAETAYDRRLYDWARDAGVATVLHTMPELHHLDEADVADVVWCPTPWRLAEIAKRTTRPVRLVPFPVAIEHFAGGSDAARQSVNVLHVAGRAAYGDRNGTKIAAAASHLFVRGGVNYGVTSQDETVPLGAGRRLMTTLRYWQLYAGADILLMPRRFGGLCLPIQEASAAGLAVVALDTEPHDWYGCADVEAEVVGQFETGSGTVDIHGADPSHVADAVLFVARGHFGGERILVERRGKAREWAEDHSWEKLLPTWHDALDEAVAAAADSRGSCRR